MAGDIWILSPRGIISSCFRTVFVVSMSIFWVEGFHYCHDDWCNYNEYCCGDDICCDYLTGYWYIWLMMGVLFFSFVFGCCWFRYLKRHSRESIEARNSKLGYVTLPSTFVTYGDEYYIHQQPPPVPFAREPPHFNEGREFESQQYASSQYYPPPYNFMERTPSPSAPPPES